MLRKSAGHDGYGWTPAQPTRTPAPLRLSGVSSKDVAFGEQPGVFTTAAACWLTTGRAAPVTVSTSERASPMRRPPQNLFFWSTLAYSCFSTLLLLFAQGAITIYDGLLIEPLLVEVALLKAFFVVKKLTALWVLASIVTLLGDMRGSTGFTR